MHEYWANDCVTLELLERSGCGMEDVAPCQHHQLLTSPARTPSLIWELGRLGMGYHLEYTRRLRLRRLVHMNASIPGSLEIDSS